MSFVVDIMTCTDETHVIRKSPSSLVELNGTLREECSLIDPIITFEYSSIPYNANYLHIPIFNRYYFIREIESIRNNLWRVKAHCDVLFTYSDYILQQTAIIARQENEWNLYLNDSMFKAYQNPMVQVKYFPSGFTTQEFVLAMAGGGVSS